MKRRILSLTLAGMLIVQMPCSVSAAATEKPVISAGKVAADAGSLVNVPIDLTGNTGIAGMQLSVTYPDGFTLVDSKQGSALKLTYTKPGDFTANPVNMVWDGQEADTSNGTIVEMSFTIPQEAEPGEYPINLNLKEALNNDLQKIDIDLVSGAIIVNAAPLTSAAVTVAAPVRGTALADTVTCGSDTYTGTVEWYLGEKAEGTAVTGMAKAATVYTAKMTLSPAEGQKFAEQVAVTVNEGEAENVTCSDGTLVVTKTFPATADKKQPVCKAPDGLTAVYGQTLADVALTNLEGNTPGTWKWNNPSESVGNVGKNLLHATFTPDDGENYAVVSDIEVSVDVTAKQVEKPELIIEPAEYDYTGTPITPTKVTVKDGETEIPEKEYTLTYTNNTEVGTATVTLTDVDGGNYILAKTSADFVIKQAAGKIEIQPPATIVYDGKPVACGEGEDLNFTYQGDGKTSVKWYADDAGTQGKEIPAPTDAGTYWIGVSATEGTNYQKVDEVSRKFTISPKEISNAEVTLGEAPTYDGTEKTIAVSSVTIDGLNVTYRIVSGDKAVNAGSYTVEVSGTGNFTGTATKEWTIQPASLSGATIAPISDAPFVKEGVEPKLNVTMHNKTLVEGTDFTSSYSNHQYVGTANVTITGKGNYTGTASKTFAIIAAENPAVIAKTATVEKGGSLDLKKCVSDAMGTVTFTLKAGSTGTIENSVFRASDAPGSATVIVTAAAVDLNSDGKEEYSEKTGEISIEVTGEPAPVVSVTSVKLDKTTLSLPAGKTAVLAATVEPKNATDKTVTWKSDNEKVATVSGDGTVTAVAVGAANITVTTKDGGHTASCKVTVTQPPVAVTGVTLNKAELALSVGGTERLTAAVLPANAEDKTITWSSDRPGVAMVSADGTVWAISKGTANITVTTNDGGKTASCTVTVTEAALPTDRPVVAVQNMTVQNVIGRDGKQVSVDLVLSQNTGMTGMVLSLSYPEGFQLDSIEKGDALSSLTYTRPSNLTTNCVNLLWDGMAADTSNGTILTLTFTLPKDAPDGTYPIALGFKSAYDKNVKPIAVSVVPGFLTVTNCKVGDVNGDGRIDSADITLIRRYLSHSYEIETFIEDAADFNHDKKQSTIDIVLIRRYVVDNSDNER